MIAKLLISLLCRCVFGLAFCTLVFTEETNDSPKLTLLLSVKLQAEGPTVLQCRADNNTDSVIRLQRPMRGGSVLVIKDQDGGERRLSADADPIFFYDIAAKSHRTWDIELPLAFQVAGLHSPEGAFTLEWQAKDCISNTINIFSEK